MEENKSKKIDELIENILSDKLNDLVVDLSNHQLDADFIKHLADAIETRPSNIGAVVLSATDQATFQNDTNYKRLVDYLRIKNENYRRFPSEYECALLTCHCNNDSNPDTNREMAQKGWVEVERYAEPIEKTNDNVSATDNDKTKNYLSILYKNDLTNNLVLAYRGLKLNARDVFLEGSKLEAAVYGIMNKETTVHSYYAFNHTHEAVKKSIGMNYYLVFTGFSFGAWLAEQSVFFCHKEYPLQRVRAITFESPGSWEIIDQMNQSNIKNDKTANQEPYKRVDVRTFLFAPNFLNTCNKHVGRVFRVAESVKKDGEYYEQLVDKYIAPNVSSGKIKDQLQKWFKNKVRDQVSKFYFYLNGLRALFMLDLRWLVDEFDPETGRFKSFPDEAEKWPKIYFEPKNHSFQEINFVNSIPILKDIIPDGWQRKISKPIGKLLDLSVKTVAQKYLSGLVVIVNVCIHVMSDEFNTDQFLKCLEFDDQKNKLSKGVTAQLDPASKSSFMMTFQGCYETKTVYEKLDYLDLSNQNFVDSKLYEFNYKNPSKYEVGLQLREQFVNLRKAFTLKRIVEEYEQVRIESSTCSIERIRERFIRLEKIYNECAERSLLTNMSAHDYNRDDLKDDDIKKQVCFVYLKNGVLHLNLFHLN